MWATLYNGTRRPFNAEPRDPNPDGVYPAERWYPMRDKRMTPSGMLRDDEIVGRQYLTQHVCVAWQVPALTSAPEIAHLQGVVRTSDLQMDSRHEYTYRWPSSWAHVLGDHQFQALCGDRMPEGRRTGSRERERLRSMPVCPRCMEHLEIPPDTRARLMVAAAREEARASAATIDPTTLGSYVRSRWGDDDRGPLQMPVHRATCPTLVGQVVNSLDWVGLDVVPRGSVVCTVCRPPVSLDDFVQQEQMAREVAEAQERRRRAKELFAPLGPYVVYKTGTVHRNDCGRLMQYPDTTGWRGVQSIDGLRPCRACEPDEYPVLP
ncbi:hypothetical protein [Isoptericola sp. NPDC058082]|uniref:hypothetical protein n=1 Tax=Isoptericola sp. NPDC058082 TaxID=3346331 RepID=UPI0036EDFD08